MYLIGDIPNVGKIRSAADQALAKGDVEQSLKFWNQVIDLEPNNESNYYKRFRVLLRQQKVPAAINDLTKAIALKPDYEAALVQRAKLYLKSGKCAEATQDFLTISRCVSISMINL